MIGSGEMTRPARTDAAVAELLSKVPRKIMTFQVSHTTPEAYQGF
jgi:hypothetical protein